MGDADDLAEQINNKINKIRNNGNRQMVNKMNEVLNRGKLVAKKDLMKEIGILDPTGKEINPLTGEAYQNLYTENRNLPGTYATISEKWTSLPVYKERERLIKMIHTNQVMLLTSGTGSGKTVLVPKFALHAYGYKARIAITNPKRKPTRDNASWAAKLMDVRLGEEVGYKYRGAKEIDQNGKRTRLVYCTDGYITAILKSDPLLTEFDMVIVDEAHERNIQIDVLLFYLKLALLQRPTLKLIIMSATINPEDFVKYFPPKQFSFARADLPGQPNFPVEEIFLKKAINEFDGNEVAIERDRPPMYIQKAIDICIQILEESDSGEILVFLTGKGDTAEACRLLREKSQKAKLKPFCVELHSGTPDMESDLASKVTLYQNQPGAPFSRKVVMSTEVAESSITIDGLVYVIDSGLSKQSRFYPDRGMEALEKRYISKAAHMQRKGRAGRTQPGVCYNLFTEEEYAKKFRDYNIEPILVSDVTEMALNFMTTPYFSHVELPFSYPSSASSASIVGKRVSLATLLGNMITPPTESFVRYALRLLYALEGLTVDKKRATLNVMGANIARLHSLPVQMSRAVLTGYDLLADGPRERRDDVLIIASIVEVTNGTIDKLIPTVQKRGAEIIKARGKSSAASAANAILQCMRHVIFPSKEIFSCCLLSDGNSYGIAEGIVFSFPCTSKGNGDVEIVSGLHWDPVIRKMIEASEKELLEERGMIEELLT